MLLFLFFGMFVTLNVTLEKRQLAMGTKVMVFVCLPQIRWPLNLPSKLHFWINASCDVTTLEGWCSTYMCRLLGEVCCGWDADPEKTSLMTSPLENQHHQSSQQNKTKC